MKELNMGLIEKVKKIIGRDLTPDEEKDLKNDESQSYAKAEINKPAKENSVGSTRGESKTESLAEYVAVIREMNSKYDSLLEIVTEERNARLANEKRINDEIAAKTNAKIDEQVKKYKEAGLIPNDNKDYENGVRKQLLNDFEGNVAIYDKFLDKSKPAINRNLSNEKTLTSQNNSNPTNSYNAIREAVKADINQSISN